LLGLDIGRHRGRTVPVRCSPASSPFDVRPAICAVRFAVDSRCWFAQLVRSTSRSRGVLSEAAPSLGVHLLSFFEN